MENIIKNIQKIQKERGFSFENMAFELDISQPAYTKLIQGKTELSVKRLYQIAKILNVDISELLDIEAKEIYSDFIDNAIGKVQGNNNVDINLIKEVYELLIKQLNSE
ncbi:MAG: helix-turn-helix transcriptional regulator, partial [Flavobacterium sp.]|nr:helix-turn-helix transcriptional regulator [Flavobacterium sp.]